MDGRRVNQVPVSRPLDNGADDSKRRVTYGAEIDLMKACYTTVTHDTKRTITNTDYTKRGVTTTRRAKCRRQSANVLERVRVERMNSAMEDLRRCLPPHVKSSFSPRQKLSKILTLRLATSYIAALGEMLTDDEPERRPSHVRQSYRRALGLLPREGSSRTCHCPSQHQTDPPQAWGVNKLR